MLMPNRAYDGLKWLALIFLPALIVLLQGCCQAFGWPLDSLVTGLNLLAVFLGSLLQVSSHHYHGGGGGHGLSRYSPASAD
ncbi:phage holin [Hutsoniella sourekii]|uniref:phage holin n=1 Tax=Hutsoniella sourekii TaxID=87650 RepID=UPI000485885A|nr:phage holin [Hutsoniella sourekii]